MFDFNFNFSGKNTWSSVSAWIALNGDLTTVDGTRYLVNSKGDNVTSTTGQGITINSTYTVPTSIELVDGNYIYYVYNGVLAEKAITTTMTDFELNSTNLSGDGVYQNFIFNSVAFTTEQKGVLENSPETFLYRVDETIKSDVLNQSEIDGLIAWFPILESGVELYDLIGEGKTTTVTTNTVTSIRDSIDTNDEIATWTLHSSSAFDIAVTTVGTDSYRPMARIYVEETDINNSVSITFDAHIVSGTPEIYSVSYGGTQKQYYDIVEGANTINLDSVDALTNFYIQFNGKELFDVEITNFKHNVITEVLEDYEVNIDSRVSGLDTSVQAISWALDTDRKPIGTNILFTQGSNKIDIGARPTAHTDVLLATKYASPTGTGDGTYGDPYSLQDAFDSLVPGDVLFLRGGTYNVPTRVGTKPGVRIVSVIGTESNPVIIESYPGEVAILDGEFRTPQDVIDYRQDIIDVEGDFVPSNHDVGLDLFESEYVYLRKLKVTGMWYKGIYLRSRHCKVEGCVAYDNFGPGIISVDRDYYPETYTDGWNKIVDNLSYNNSCAGIADEVHDDGGNSDGIQSASGKFNIMEYNTVHDCGDDGMDFWRSDDCIARYNLIYNIGKGTGNGNGLKLGSTQTHGDRNHAYYNIIHSCVKDAVVQNGGTANEIYYNTTWNNGGMAFNVTTNAQVYYNISMDNSGGHGYYSTNGSRVGNSWQVGDDVVTFESTDETDENFLVPIKEVHKDIGVYEAGVENVESVYSYSMSFNPNQASQIVTTVPTEPYSIKVTLPDDIIYIYTDDKAGTRHLYIDSVEQATPDEITGNLTLDYVSQLTGGNVSERTKYEVYNGILTVSNNIIMYSFTQDLIVDGDFRLVPNTGFKLNDGKLYMSDKTTEYIPNSEQYPLNGTIDLTNGKMIDSQLVLVDTEQTFLYCYEIVIGTFKLIAIHYKGNGTANVYQADEINDWSQIKTNAVFDIETPFTVYEIPTIPNKIDILDTLPSSIISGSGQTISYTRHTPNSFHLDVTVSGDSADRPSMLLKATEIFTTTDIYTISFEATVVSGTAEINKFWGEGTNFYASHTITNGTNEIEIPTNCFSGSVDTLNMYFDGYNNLFDIDINTFRIMKGE